MKISELFHRTALHFPDVIAIFDEQGTLSFHELSTAIRHTAAKLQGHGINSGMGVGVLGSNSRYFIIMAYAVMECDAVVMPLSNQLSERELTEVIQTAGLHAILDDYSRNVIHGDANAKAKDIDLHELTWRLTIHKNGNISSRFAPHVKDPALIRFTSGTTGTSKGVILSHATIEDRIKAANGALQLGPDDRVLWVLSMAYHFVVSIILYLHHGAGIIICNNFNAGAMLEMINKFNATFLYASPMHIRMLANDSGSMNMDSVKKVISTSTAISKMQCDTFFGRFGKPVIQAYGIIELGLPVINLQKSIEAPDAIGYAVPGYEVGILDDEFNELPPCSIGHLAMRGPGMLDAYLAPPKTRDEILQHGWFMTGDLASKNADGLIKVEGRKKSMINVAGNKVFPEEVEAVLNQHPSIQLSRVNGYQHYLLGESIQAELLVHPGKEKPDPEDLRAYCRERLSPHKVPQKLIFVDTLPLTDSGKLIR